MNSGIKELIAVLVTMGVLLIFALVAVGVFLKVWRQEKMAKNKEHEINKD